MYNKLKLFKTSRISKISENYQSLSSFLYKYDMYDALEHFKSGRFNIFGKVAFKTIGVGVGVGVASIKLLPSLLWVLNESYIYKKNTKTKISA